MGDWSREIVKMNVYDRHITNLFNETNITNQQSAIFDKLIHTEIKDFKNNPKSSKYFGSTLVVSDWTGPNEGGWQINQRTGVSRVVTDTNYEEELLHYKNFNALIFFAGTSNIWKVF
jgi:hypothetical protein